MALHTVTEAQSLTGKSRRTIYRDMAEGRLSWVSGVDGGRRLDTSELIRAYGALKPVAHGSNAKMAQAGTADGTSNMELILSELRALRKEVSELRQAVLLIEHKPDEKLMEPTESLPIEIEQSLPWWKRPIFT